MRALSRVVQHLGAVGAERVGCQGMLDAEFTRQLGQCGADPLEWNPRAADRGQHQTLGKTDERNHRDTRGGPAAHRRDDRLRPMSATYRLTWSFSGSHTEPPALVTFYIFKLLISIAAKLTSRGCCSLARYQLHPAL
jgi:hypothetical protein